MKTISLMRHGDAPYSPLGNDFNRVLSERGKEEAKEAARYLDANYQIDLVISSDAPRAKETAEIILKTLDNKAIVHKLDHEIYKGLREELLSQIILSNLVAKHPLIIGHNPSILESIISILNKDSEDYNNIAIQSMRTCQIITFNITNKKEGRCFFKLDDIFVPNEIL